MIFSSPIPWEAAIQHEQVKVLLANDARSADLLKLAPAIRRRARFSAGVTDLRLLGHMDEMLTRVASPETVIDPDTGERRAALPGEYMDRATFRQEMTATLRSIQYSPDPAKRGTIQDLLSEQRQDTIFDTNLQMVHNHGDWLQGQHPAVLDQWPAQEFLRVESRQERRSWGSLWNEAIRALPRTSAKPVGNPKAESGMYALKNDPIWRAINHFGQPYGPWHFGSGMGTHDVDRTRAIELGLMSEHTAIEPEERPLNQDLSASTQSLPPSLLNAAIRAFGEAVRITADQRLALVT